MKNFFVLSACLSATIAISSCNSAKVADKEKQDSIQAAAAADSMLRDVLATDTLTTDTLKTDTLKK